MSGEERKGREGAVNNFIDRAVGFVAPAWGLSRLEARFRLHQIDTMIGGYDGSDMGSRQLAFWTPGRGDANEDTLPKLQVLRQNSRALVRNTPIAGAAIDRKATNVVGWGLVPRPQIDRAVLGLTKEQADEFETSAAREFELWSNSKNSDASNCQSFREQQDLAARSTWENGDSFGIITAIDRVNWPYKTAVQLYEADQISNPSNTGFSIAGKITADGPGKGNEVLDGIEVGDRGESLAIHIRSQHPGAPMGMKDAPTWTRVPIATETGTLQVLHLYGKKRIGQVRGVPILGPVVQQLKQLGDYTKAEIFAALLGAMVTVVQKQKNPKPIPNPDPRVSQTEAAERPTMTAEAGGVLYIPATDGFEVPTVGRPNSAFEAFFDAVVRQIGSRLEIPYEVLMMSFMASYSASRAALEVAWQSFRRDRFWLEARFCQPVYETVIAEGVAAGRLTAPGFFEDPALRMAWTGAEWVGPARIQIDPLKENNADKIAKEEGWKSDTEITAEKTGGSFRRKTEIRAADKAAEQAAGLVPARSATPPGAAVPAPPGSEPEDRPEDADDRPEDETEEAPEDRPEDETEEVT